MSSSKVAALLRQIDQFQKSTVLTEEQKSHCISDVRKQINEVLGQRPLDLAGAGAEPQGSQAQPAEARVKR